MSVYVELSFKNEDVIEDVNSYMNQVIEDLRKAEIITDHKLISFHSVVMNPAYVHIKEESIKDVIEKKDILSAYKIYSIGRYGSWTYSSIEDNMIEAINLSKTFN